MREFLRGIEEINIVLYPSSWGALQCNAKYMSIDGEKEYHSWAGRADWPITIKTIVDALNLINKQIEEEKCQNS